MIGLECILLVRRLISVVAAQHVTVAVFALVTEMLEQEQKAEYLKLVASSPPPEVKMALSKGRSSLSHVARVSFQMRLSQRTFWTTRTEASVDLTKDRLFGKLIAAPTSATVSKIITANSNLKSMFIINFS